MADSTIAMVARYAAGQGWTDATVMGLLIDYIDERGEREEFADYLSTRIYIPENEED